MVPRLYSDEQLAEFESCVYNQANTKATCVFCDQRLVLVGWFGLRFDFRRCSCVFWRRFMERFRVLQWSFERMSGLGGLEGGTSGHGAPWNTRYHGCFWIFDGTIYDGRYG
jgi:hypothetical protein